jgi:hypothetical protein
MHLFHRDRTDLVEFSPNFFCLSIGRQLLAKVVHADITATKTSCCHGARPVGDKLPLWGYEGHALGFISITF